METHQSNSWAVSRAARFNGIKTEIKSFTNRMKLWDDKRELQIKLPGLVQLEPLRFASLDKDFKNKEI